MIFYYINKTTLGYLVGRGAFFSLSSLWIEKFVLEILKTVVVSKYMYCL